MQQNGKPRLVRSKKVVSKFVVIYRMPHLVMTTLRKSIVQVILSKKCPISTVTFIIVIDLSARVTFKASTTI
jgi:hypothetical protein